MSVQYKGGVNLDVIPQIRGAISIAETVFSRWGYIPVVTSARDSNHSPSSLHYIGAAIDLKSKGLPSNVKQGIFGGLKSLLPFPTWWVDLEFLGQAQEHYHIGYNPARRTAELDKGDYNEIYYSDAPYELLSPTDLIMTSYLPQDTGYTPDSEQAYPQYPPGTIPQEYFTTYEQPLDWKILVMAAFAVYFLIDVTSN